MSSIQDMNNRIKQNRNLLPSKRAKFKENNRATIYAGTNNDNKPSFKKFSEFQIKKTITKIREDAKSEKRSKLILMIIFFGIIGLFITYAIISTKDNSKKPIINESTIDYDTSPPIIWSGKRSDPLKVPFSNLFYSPFIGNMDFEVQIDKSYTMHNANMVVDNTTNIFFFDNKCNLIGKLLPKNGHISRMFVGPSKMGLCPKKIIYVLAERDKNNDGFINDNDRHNLYISELNGKDLTRITELGVSSIQWVGKGNEIQIKLNHAKEANDSLYGIYNTVTKELKLTNHPVEPE